jgi:hypothetical protein
VQDSYPHLAGKMGTVDVMRALLATRISELYWEPSVSSFKFVKLP